MGDAPERRVKIFFEEQLNGGAVGLLIAALHRDSDGLTGLDAHAHEGHELGGRGGLAAVSLGNSDGAVQALGGFGQQAGGAGVDAYRVGDGVLKLFHGECSFQEISYYIVYHIRREKSIFML